MKTREYWIPHQVRNDREEQEVREYWIPHQVRNDREEQEVREYWIPHQVRNDRVEQEVREYWIPKINIFLKLTIRPIRPFGKLMAGMLIAGKRR